MTYCLSIHARYRCAHSGACCADVWAIPVEPHVVELIRDKELVLAGSGPWLVPSERPEAFQTELVAAHYDGACAFFEHGDRLCTIHRQRGVDALPSSCRHFPRVHLIDPRGTFLSLSHFCPTAARMLLDEVPIGIVEAAPPLALDGAVEGLNALDALPPLVRPDLLADLEGYAAWERACLDTLGRADLTHTQALEWIDAATEAVRRWHPREGALAERVGIEFRRAGRAAGGPALRGDAERLDLVDAAMPPALGARTRAAATADLSPFDGAVKRYLAARLFGTWLTYRTRGLRSIVEWLHVCLAVLRNEYVLAANAPPVARDFSPAAPAAAFIEAVRETDRVLIHVIHLQVLAAELEPVEQIQR